MIVSDYYEKYDKFGFNDLFIFFQTHDRISPMPKQVLIDRISEGPCLIKRWITQSKHCMQWGEGETKNKTGCTFRPNPSNMMEYIFV